MVLKNPEESYRQKLGLFLGAFILFSAPPTKRLLWLVGIYQRHCLCDLLRDWMKQWKKLHLTISHLGWVDWISYKPDYWLGAVVVAVPNVSNIMVRFLKRVIFRGAKWYIHVQSPSHFQFFATPWTAAHQASQSPTISWSLPRFKSSALVMPSSHLILWCPPFPSALNLSLTDLIKF